MNIKSKNFGYKGFVGNLTKEYVENFTTASIRTAARRIGITVEEYLDKKAQGLRWCYYHRVFHNSDIMQGKLSICKEADKLIKQKASEKKKLKNNLK